MKATNTQKKAAREIKTHGGAGRVQDAARRNTRNSIKAAAERRVAAERQVAEIERTFTLRYEW